MFLLGNSPQKKKEEGFLGEVLVRNPTAPGEKDLLVFILGSLQRKEGKTVTSRHDRAIRTEESFLEVEKLEFLSRRERKKGKRNA